MLQIGYFAHDPRVTVTHSEDFPMLTGLLRAAAAPRHGKVLGRAAAVG